MALKGTLKDFGIADIFQLIGHQSKTGELVLRNHDQDVRIRFREGNVVKAESTSRERKDMLGSMLVRSDVMTQPQLDQALETQRRTLKRLGDILLEFAYVDPAVLREFTRLQTTETIYKLFLWKDGTYEFTQEEPAAGEQPEASDPIRSESILMEGFRMVDEWPLVRKKVTSYAMTFRVLKPISGGGGGSSSSSHSDAETDFLSGLDDSFGAPAKPAKGGDEDKLGPNERLIFSLVTPGRDVQKLIDLSRLGEFETCKALLNLMEHGYLVGITAAATQGSGLAEGGALEPPRMRLMPGGRWQTLVGWTAGAMMVLGFVWVFELDPRSLMRSDRVKNLATDAARSRLGELSLERLQRALEVYRLQHGTYPDTLDALVDAHLVNPQQLSQPFERPYSYVKDGQSYRLVRPFF